jgi:2-haloacid dehalogenase
MAGTPDAFLVRQIADDAQRLKFIEDTDLWAWHDSLDGGRPFDEAARELSEVFPAYADLISAWGSRFGETISGPIEPVHAMSRSWTRPGCRCSRSPISPPISGRPSWRRSAPSSPASAGSWCPGEEKLLKPDPAIYWLALDRFGLKPADALFVDDRRINVEGAEAIGLPAHLFTDAVALRERLVAEGLLPGRS